MKVSLQAFIMPKKLSTKCKVPFRPSGCIRFDSCFSCFSQVSSDFNRMFSTPFAAGFLTYLKLLPGPLWMFFLPFKRFPDSFWSRNLATEITPDFSTNLTSYCLVIRIFFQQLSECFSLVIWITFQYFSHNFLVKRWILLI